MRNGHKEREIAGEGLEHNILWPSTGNRRQVLKVPRRLNSLMMLRLKSADTIREEVRQARELIHGTEVKIPRTKVHRINGSYVMRQDWIDEDQSVPDVANYLREQGLETLVDEYKHEPLNFVAKEGVVYWVDPTKGVAGRVLDRIPLSLVNSHNWRKAKVLLSKPIRFAERIARVYKHKRV